MNINKHLINMSTEIKSRIKGLTAAINKSTTLIEKLKKELIKKETLTNEALRAAKFSTVDDKEYAEENNLDVKTYESEKTKTLKEKEDACVADEEILKETISSETAKRKAAEIELTEKEQELALYQLPAQMNALFLLAGVNTYEDLLVSMKAKYPTNASV